MSTIPFAYQVRIGYPEVDRMGFLHHSRHLVHMESARIELLRTTGVSYLQWEDRGYLIPVTQVHVDYGSPARFDDVLQVAVTLKELTRLRMTFGYEITCPERSAEIARGSSSHVFMNPGGRPVRLAPDLLALLQPFLPEAN